MGYPGRTRFFRPWAISACCLAVAILAVSCTPSDRYLIRRQDRLSAETRYVRVLVGKFRDEVVITSGEKIKVTDRKSERFSFIDPGKKVGFRAESLKSPLEVESWNSPLAVNGKRYRGAVELHNVTGMVYVINNVKLDDYLLGVVPSEMPAGWPLEAMKSQAVAARTYAYYHILKQKNQLYDLDATTSSQVYGGVDAEKESGTRAVASTSGEIITYQRMPILSYFHSTCGGKTVDARHVWQNSDFPYLDSVQCPYCSESPKYSWEYRLGINEIKAALRREYPEVRTIQGISLKKLQGRVTNVVVRHGGGIVRLTGNQFRLMVSPYKVKSLFFSAEKSGKALLLKGKGWGHGVGLCQYGAKGMAEKGHKHRDILKFYYSGVEIINIDGKGQREPSFSREVARRTARPDSHD